MTDVFISYSHKDFDYAHRLADELKNHHIDVWIDDRIDYGDEWPRTIQENLAACRTFIVIMSTNAFNSMWVQNEVSYAQSTHKAIFPLLLEGEIWLSMAAMQYVDVTTGEMPPGRFFEKVQNSLNQPVSHAPERKAVEVPAVQHTKERAPGTRKRRTGLFLAGSLLVIVVAGIVYNFLRPDPRNGTTPPDMTNTPSIESPTEVPATEIPAVPEVPPTTPPATIPEPTQITMQPSVIPTPLGGRFGEIAFISQRDGNWEGYLMDSDGTDQKNVTNNPTIEDAISLSPDGKKLLYNSSRGGNADVYIANADGSDERRLTDHPAIDGGARWSLDGTRIAFSSERDGNWEIYVMNADGTGQTRLTNNSAEDFVTDWSPDSAWIAFFSTRDGNWEIYVMRIDGSMVIRLTDNPADDGAPTFSSMGDRVVFHSNRDGNWEIYSVYTNGSGLFRLTENPANDEFPCWSPDGKLIAFGSDRDGDYEIYVMRTDGSGVVKLTENIDSDNNPTW